MPLGPVSRNRIAPRCKSPLLTAEAVPLDRGVATYCRGRATHCNMKEAPTEVKCEAGVQLHTADYECLALIVDYYYYYYYYQNRTNSTN